MVINRYCFSRLFEKSSLTLTTAMGMEKDHFPFLSLPQDIYFKIIGDALNLSGEEVRAHDTIGKEIEFPPLTQQYIPDMMFTR